MALTEIAKNHGVTTGALGSVMMKWVDMTAIVLDMTATSLLLIV